LHEAAVQVLRANDAGTFTRPSTRLYPHQSLWDSCLIAIGLRHLDPARAATEILSLFWGQWPNGMLPHIAFAGPADRCEQYHAGPRLWRVRETVPAPPAVETSGVTQPPMVADAVVRVGETMRPADRLRLYRSVLPGLVRYHEWLYRERELDGTGLVTLVHPEESAMDDTPPWTELARRVAPLGVRLLRGRSGEALLGRLRRDTADLPPSDRIRAVDLFTLYRITRKLRRAGYDLAAIRSGGIPLVQDVGFNAVLVRANSQLLRIGREVGAPLPGWLRRAMHRTAETLDWLHADGGYRARDARTGRPVGTETVAGFLPLYAGVVPAGGVPDVIARMTSARWWSRVGVASVPLDAAEFQPRRSWRGPVRVTTNWLIADGLDRMGRPADAQRLRAHTIEMAATSGLREYYSPFDSSGAGAGDFSPTAALLIDMMAALATPRRGDGAHPAWTSRYRPATTVPLGPGFHPGAAVPR
jgi:hypothetical protein